MDMAYKSLVLSIALTFLVGYSLTAGLTNPNSPLKKLPDWTAFPLMGVVFVLYLLAAWWAVKGFGEHKTAAVFSMCFCVLGLGLYAAGFVMTMGKSKASPGQYDYDFSRLDVSEKAALAQIVENAGLGMQDATFSEHWHMVEDAAGYRICVQKGHVTALRFSDKKIPDLEPFSRLPKLGDLYLVRCGLADMSALRADGLDRLDLSGNRISDLKTLGGCPNVRWLDLKGNQITSDEDLSLFPKLVSRDLSGNPFLK